GLHNQIHGLVGIVQSILLDLLGALLIFLASKHCLHPPYSPTTTPMERAVPAIMLMAASMLAAFRSGILVSAILRTSSLLMVATLVLLGTPEPDSMLQAFLISTAAGGVLVTKVKERSAYTVMMTGMIMPTSFL